jgi:ABC-type multidrug transport system ATPase subunit
MEQPVVDVTDLSRSFGSKTALDGVSFRATVGQVYGLVGANGAGKTTLLKHLLGLLRAATGSVRVFGLDPVRDGRARERRSERPSDGCKPTRQHDRGPGLCRTFHQRCARCRE